MKRATKAQLRTALRKRLAGRRVTVPIEKLSVGDTIAFWGVDPAGGRFGVVTRVHPRLREVRVVCRVRIAGEVFVLWKDTVHESQITENLGRRRARDMGTHRA